MKLAKYYYYGTIFICTADLLDNIRNVLWPAKMDLIAAITGSAVAIWLIIALLVLVESIRTQKMVPPALFYVVTMATFLISTPALQARWGHFIEALIMVANIFIHALYMTKPLKREQAPPPPVSDQ